MTTTRAVLGAALRTFNFQPRFTTHHLPSRNSYNTFSTLADRALCQCGQKMPKAKKMIRLFRERRLRQITQELKCPYFHSFQFNPTNDCALVDTIEEVATSLLGEFEDVICIGESRSVFLEALHEVPTGDVGDLTGDHGKQLIKFLHDCIEDNLISNVGSILDIGGQNNLTVQRVSKLLDDPDLPAVVVDLNAVTPALSQARTNIKYAVEDAFTFFSSENYPHYVKNVVNQQPMLCLLNNTLNVLQAEKGWQTLEAAWGKLRPGDYLVISGLVPKQLEKHGFIKYREVDGIIEFHHRQKGFYKSALSSDFFDYVIHRLSDSSVLVEETFKFPVQTLQANVIEIKGRRLLTLKKQ